MISVSMAKIYVWCVRCRPFADYVFFITSLRNVSEFHKFLTEEKP